VAIVLHKREIIERWGDDLSFEGPGLRFGLGGLANSLVTPFVSEEVFNESRRDVAVAPRYTNASEITKICAALIFFASSPAAFSDCCVKFYP